MHHRPLHGLLPAALTLALVAGLGAPFAAEAGPKWLDRLKGEEAEQPEGEEAKAEEQKPAEEGKKQRGKREESAGVRKVKGRNDMSGEIHGTAAANSPFLKVEIGMPEKQVIDLIGPPGDSGSYTTAKSYLPFVHYGGDNSRSEWVYKGAGRLIFTHSNNGSSYLIKIIHDGSEDGYR